MRRQHSHPPATSDHAKNMILIIMRGSYIKYANDPRRTIQSCRLPAKTKAQNPGLERAPYHIFRVPFRYTKIKGVYLPRAGRQVSCSGGSTCLPAIPNMAARFYVTSRPLPRFTLIYYVSPKLSQVFSSV